MNKISVLAVDDSPFSQKVVKDSLLNSEYEVVDTAGTANDGIEKYKKIQPDIVTMDLTLPDMDGLECCRKIFAINPHAKIIIISAMKDEAIINRGAALGVRAFLQKPIKAEELKRTIACTLNGQQEISEYSDEFLHYLAKSFSNNLFEMAALESKIEITQNQEKAFSSDGIAIIIGLSGARQGRILLDLKPEVASKLVTKILQTDEISNEDLLNTIAEFTNIIAGHSVSYINNLFNGVEPEIRLTPPSILLGDSLSIINPKLTSCTVTAQTDVGLLNINVGFLGRK